MADRDRDAQRRRFEERFQKAQAKEAGAKELIEADREATRAKTARLKEQRFAKAAADEKAASKRSKRKR